MPCTADHAALGLMFMEHFLLGPAMTKGAGRPPRVELLCLACLQLAALASTAACLQGSTQAPWPQGRRVTERSAWLAPLCCSACNAVHLNMLDLRQLAEAALSGEAPLNTPWSRRRGIPEGVSPASAPCTQLTLAPRPLLARMQLLVDATTASELAGMLPH